MSVRSSRRSIAPESAEVQAARRAMGYDGASIGRASSLRHAGADAHTLRQYASVDNVSDLRRKTSKRDPARDSFLRGGSQFHGFKHEKPKPNNGAMSKFVNVMKRAVGGNVKPSAPSRQASLRSTHYRAPMTDARDAAAASLNRDASLRSVRSFASITTVTATASRPHCPPPHTFMTGGAPADVFRDDASSIRGSVRGHDRRRWQRQPTPVTPPRGADRGRTQARTSRPPPSYCSAEPSRAPTAASSSRDSAAAARFGTDFEATRVWAESTSTSPPTTTRYNGPTSMDSQAQIPRRAQRHSNSSSTPLLSKRYTPFGLRDEPHFSVRRVSRPEVDVEAEPASDSADKQSAAGARDVQPDLHSATTSTPPRRTASGASHTETASTTPPHPAPSAASAARASDEPHLSPASEHDKENATAGVETHSSPAQAAAAQARPSTTAPKFSAASKPFTSIRYNAARLASAALFEQTLNQWSDDDSEQSVDSAELLGLSHARRQGGRPQRFVDIAEESEPPTESDTSSETESDSAASAVVERVKLDKQAEANLEVSIVQLYPADDDDDDDDDAYVDKFAAHGEDVEAEVDLQAVSIDAYLHAHRQPRPLYVVNPDKSVRSVSLQSSINASAHLAQAVLDELSAPGYGYNFAAAASAATAAPAAARSTHAGQYAGAHAGGEELGQHFNGRRSILGKSCFDSPILEEVSELDLLQKRIEVSPPTVNEYTKPIARPSPSDAVATTTATATATDTASAKVSNAAASTQHLRAQVTSPLKASRLGSAGLTRSPAGLLHKTRQQRDFSRSIRSPTLARLDLAARTAGQPKSPPATQRLSPRAALPTMATRAAGRASVRAFVDQIEQKLQTSTIDRPRQHQHPQHQQQQLQPPKSRALEQVRATTAYTARGRASNHNCKRVSNATDIAAAVEAQFGPVLRNDAHAPLAHGHVSGDHLATHVDIASSAADVQDSELHRRALDAALSLATEEEEELEDDDIEEAAREHAHIDSWRRAVAIDFANLDSSVHLSEDFDRSGIDLAHGAGHGGASSGGVVGSGGDYEGGYEELLKHGRDAIFL